MNEFKSNLNNIIENGKKDFYNREMEFPINMEEWKKIPEEEKYKNVERHFTNDFLDKIKDKNYLYDDSIINEYSKFIKKDGEDSLNCLQDFNIYLMHLIFKLCDTDPKILDTVMTIINSDMINLSKKSYLAFRIYNTHYNMIDEMFCNDNVKIDQIMNMKFIERYKKDNNYLRQSQILDNEIKKMFYENNCNI